MWSKSEINYLRGTHPLIMAHRGNSIIVPENSLLAFQQAYDLKVDVIETDAHLTKDNNIVFFHDATLNRVTGVKGKIADKTLEELKAIDLGAKFKDENGNLPYLGKGLVIQTIEEILDKFRDIKFNIDIKSRNPDAPKVLSQKLNELNAQNRVMVGSFHQKQIIRFREYSDIPTSAGPFEVINFLKKSTKSNQPGKTSFVHAYHAIQVPEKVKFISIVNPRTIQFAHDNQIAVHVWTINDQKKMIELLKMGVDGIFTDNPELLIETHKSMGLI